MQSTIKRGSELGLWKYSEVSINRETLGTRGTRQARRATRARQLSRRSE